VKIPKSVTINLTEVEIALLMCGLNDFNCIEKDFVNCPNCPAKEIYCENNDFITNIVKKLTEKGDLCDK